MKKEQTQSLLREYCILFGGVCCTILIVFLLTQYVVNEKFKREMEETAEVVFNQASDSISQTENNIGNLCMHIASEKSVQQFLKAASLGERYEVLSEVQKLTRDCMGLNENLVNILIYNSRNELIYSSGNPFIQMPRDMFGSRMMLYSGKIADYQGATFYGISMPVYEKSDSNYNVIGYVFSLFEAENLQDIVELALANKETTIALLDKNGRELVHGGQWKPEFARGGLSEKEYIIYWKQFESSGHRLIFAVPKASILSNMNFMVGLSYFTYCFLLIIVAGVGFILYRRILKPIRKQVEFMNSYTENLGARIMVIERNEIGELAYKMNDMLDEIETLNRQILLEKEKQLQIEYDKKQTQMIAVKSQVNPHFMYNTFDCIRGMALYHGEREISDLVQSLSKLFRYNIKGEEIVTVREALQNLQEYSNIIHYRFQDKYAIIVEAQKETLSVKIPKMILQPLVENAVIHGLEPKMGRGKVRVFIRKNHLGRLVLNVEDDGIGMDTDRLKELRMSQERFDVDGIISDAKGGIGFLNVYQRLRLFYGNNVAMEVDSTENEGSNIKIEVYDCLD